MKYIGLLDDQELFQCTFLLVLAISSCIGALISIIFMIFGFPYSGFMLIIMLIMAISSLWKFKDLQFEIEKKEKEFEAHERKENRELET
jgi:hypothetical protein